MERSEGLETFSWAVPTPWGPVETSGTGGVIISGFAHKSRVLISDFVKVTSGSWQTEADITDSMQMQV